MKIIQGDRALLYRIVAALFKSIDLQPTIAELGVLRGDNALQLYGLLQPRHMYLIDAWSTAPFDAYMATNAMRDWVDNISVFEAYYDGPVNSPETFDRIYQAAVRKFHGITNVSILRRPTEEALGYIRQVEPALEFDFVYVDANHEFEKVLDDLMLYTGALSGRGLIQLNDCCFSTAGVRQNLGVLEAVTKFCKLKSFVPIAMANADWTDVLLCRSGSELLPLFDQLVRSNDIAYVELPPQLLGSARVVYGRRANLSFL